MAADDDLEWLGQLHELAAEEARHAASKDGQAAAADPAPTRKTRRPWRRNTAAMSKQFEQRVEAAEQARAQARVQLLAKELIAAASGGNLEDVKRLVGGGAPLDCRHLGYTPVLLAVSGGHPGCVSWLLEAMGDDEDLLSALRTPTADATRTSRETSSMGWEHSDILKFAVSVGAEADAGVAARYVGSVTAILDAGHQWPSIPEAKRMAAKASARDLLDCLQTELGECDCEYCVAERHALMRPEPQSVTRTTAASLLQ